MKELNFDTGLVEMKVNGCRTIKINTTDVGFLETLYGLVGKIESIETERKKKCEKTDDLAKQFDYYRASDKLMRNAVDSVFGDGFCDEVFQGIRLTAGANGLTVLENFIFALIDEMDDTIKENVAMRSDRISKYTAKYEKYHAK